MYPGLFVGGVVEVEGAAAGELVDGWLVVRFAAGGARLEGRGGGVIATAAAAVAAVLGIGGV